jgi:hypothetical protein
MPSNIVFLPFQTSPENNNKSKAEYTNTQQDLTVGWWKITNSIDMQSFWLVDYFAEKQQRVCPYFQNFSSNSSRLIITK